ncbi:hypothetical protein DFS34DRAFT_646025 [Phlyctochytrium arcticum]|nr:hypothetical protein DFS34DRAFT_646025 [Phlyctochytrium arcticum]
MPRLPPVAMEGSSSDSDSDQHSSDFLAGEYSSVWEPSSAGLLRCTVCNETSQHYLSRLQRHERSKSHQIRLRQKGLQEFDSTRSATPSTIDQTPTEHSSSPNSPYNPSTSTQALPEPYIPGYVPLSLFTEDTAQPNDFNFNLHAHLEDIRFGAADEELAAFIASYQPEDDYFSDDESSDNGNRMEAQALDASSTTSQSDDDEEEPSQAGADPSYYPFANRSEALIAMLMHIPRHHMSAKVLENVWWWGRQHKIKLSAVKSIKKKLKIYQEKIGVESFETTTRHGVPLTINKPSAIVKQEIANPIVMRQLNTQAQQLSGMISELYQSEKWTTNPYVRTPMIKQRFFDYYLGEFAKLKTGEIICIENFCLVDTALYVEGSEVVDKGGNFWINKRAKIRREVNVLEGNVTIETSTLKGYIFDGPLGIPQRRYYSEIASLNLTKLNELCVRAGGHRVILVPLVLYCDNASGNVSKKWNGFYNCIATSKKSSALEMADAVVDDIVEVLEKGIVAFDSIAREEVLAIGSVFCIEGDNPMHAKLCSNTSIGSGLHFCRFCHASGKLHSVEALTAYLSCSRPRSWDATRSTLVEYLKLAGQPRGQKQIRSEDTATGTTCAYTSYNLTTIAEFAETPTWEETAAYCQTLGPDDPIINPIFRLGR